MASDSNCIIVHFGAKFTLLLLGRIAGALLLNFSFWRASGGLASPEVSRFGPKAVCVSEFFSSFWRAHVDFTPLQLSNGEEASKKKKKTHGHGEDVVEQWRREEASTTAAGEASGSDARSNPCGAPLRTPTPPSSASSRSTSPSRAASCSCTRSSSPPARCSLAPNTPPPRVGGGWVILV